MWVIHLVKFNGDSPSKMLIYAMENVESDLSSRMFKQTIKN
jgi:hypothetical protein